jgi:hypothetical protein
VFLAMTFGGILCAAAITLFVAAHWEQLSPASRLSLVLAMVALFSWRSTGETLPCFFDDPAWRGNGAAGRGYFPHRADLQSA